MLRPLLDRAGIDGTIIVQQRRPKPETDYLLIFPLD